MKKNENEFRSMLKDISEKVQNSKIILTSQTIVNVENEINFKEIRLESLSNKNMYKLILPPNKSSNDIYKEFCELLKDTNGASTNVTLKDIYNHELFTFLGGNPLCGLLVSSNTSSIVQFLNTFFRIFNA